MKQDIKSIRIIFENCDVADVPAKNIKRLFLHETGSYFDYMDGYASVSHETDVFRLDLINVNTTPMFYDDKSLQDRILAHNDITQIKITDGKGKTKKFHVPWKDTNRDKYSNSHQRSRIEDGILCIDIYPKRPVRQWIMELLDSLRRFYRRTRSRFRWRIFWRIPVAY